MGRLLGESSITIADLGAALTEASQAFVDMARKFQVAAQHFARIAELTGDDDE